MRAVGKHILNTNGDIRLHGGLLGCWLILNLYYKGACIFKKTKMFQES